MPHIFLYGPSGVGKSTLGQSLANRLNLPFVDSDRVIEIRAGRSIPQIMEKQGMEKVRDLETAALKQIVENVESVVALGGGALLRDENRSLVENNGKVVLLMAEFATLFERLQNDSNKRPLLEGDLKSKLGSYLEGRVEHYASFPLRIHVDDRSVEDNVIQAQVMLGRFHLKAMGEYDVIVQDQGIDQLGQLLRARGVQNCIIVTDENVRKFHLERVTASLREGHLDPNSLVIPSGEAHKNLEMVNGLWHGFLENGLDRQSTVIAVGGGVIGDMTGFAASTYMRGVNWVAIPTTLLSMVDASLGGKTGFDLPEGKNLIGSFHPPKLVLADPQLLKTLPEAELVAGLAEVVKHGIISDPELFALCQRGLHWIRDNLEEIVRRAMAVKIKVIEEDPYEKGFRAALNLGHTVGHAVELVSKFELRHGEAIAIGTVVEAKYAERIGLAATGLSGTICETLSALGLPTAIPGELPPEEIIRAMRVDKKKNAKAIRLALPVEIGKVELVDVTDLESVLE
jgi:shikimate kinase/3-dehydroquinate synthase